MSFSRRPLDRLAAVVAASALAAASLATGIVAAPAASAVARYTSTIVFTAPQVLIPWGTSVASVADEGRFTFTPQTLTGATWAANSSPVYYAYASVQAYDSLGAPITLGSYPTSTCGLYLSTDGTYANRQTGTVAGPKAYIARCIPGTPVSGYTNTIVNNSASAVQGEVSLSTRYDNATTVELGATLGSFPSTIGYVSSKKNGATGSAPSASCAVFASADTTYVGTDFQGTAPAVGSYAAHCALAAQASPALWRPSYAGDITVTVTKHPSVTTVTCPVSAVFTGAAQAPCTVSVVGGGQTFSGTPEYTSNTNAGVVTASYSFLGTVDVAASSGSSTFEITKAASSTSLTCPASVVYSAAAQTPCSAAVTGVGGLSTTAAVSYANNTNVGTATADATYAGDANHSSSSAAQSSFGITRFGSVVTASSGSIDYGSNLPTVTYTTNPFFSAGEWSTAPTCAAYAAGNFASALSGVQPAGTYVSHCEGGVAGNINPSYVDGVITVAKVASTTVITCGASSFTYTGSALTPCTVRVTGVGLDTTGAVTYTNNVNTGTATASFTYPGDVSHNSSQASVDFTIAKAPSVSTITCPVPSYTYSASAFTPCSVSVTGAGGLATSGSVVYANNTNAGTATADFTYPGDSNHDGSIAPQGSFTISPANSTTKVTCPTTVVYSAAAQTPCSAAVTGVGGLSTTAAVSYANNTNVGTATADATYAGDANHSSSSAAQSSFGITRFGSVVTASSGSIDYGSNLPTVTYTTNPFFSAGEWSTAPTCAAYAAGNFASALSGVQPAGTYVSHCEGGVAGNINPSYVDGVITVAKVASTTVITCGASSFTYTGSALTPCTVRVTGVGLDTTGAVTYTNNVNTGTATASFTYPGDVSHNSSQASVDFTIAKAPSVSTITCPVPSYTYSASAFTPCSVSVTGAGGLATSGSVVYANNTNAGTATADFTYPGDSNHDGSIAPQGSFTISPANSTTKVTCPTTAIYVDSPVTPCTVSVLAPGVNLTPEASYSDNAAPGTATAAYTYSGDSNINGSSDSVTFEVRISKVDSVVTVSSANLTYGDALPEATYTTNPSMASSDWTVAPSCYVYASLDSGFATPLSGVQGAGSYTTHCSGGVSLYFNPTYVDGAITIAKAVSSSVITCPASVFYTSAALTPCSVAVTGTNLNTSATPVYGNNTNPGSATADFTFLGDANHTGSTATQASFTIAKAITSTVITCPASVVYTSSSQQPCQADVTGSGLSTSTNVSYGNNVNAGSATANAGFAGDSNYAASTATQATFTIAKAPSTSVITCNPTTYTGSAQTPCQYAVTGAGGLNSSGSIAAYTNNVNVGNATANYTYSGDANHDGSAATPVSFAIGKAASLSTITCAYSSLTYTGAALTPCSVVVTGDGGLNNTSGPVVYTNNVNVGSAFADFTYLGDANHFGSTAVQTGFTITRASVSVTAATPTAIAYGTSVPVVAFATSPTLVTWTVSPTCAVYASSDSTFATALSGVQSAGSYVTHCSGGTSANYSASGYVNGALTINKANATIIAASPASVSSTTVMPTIAYTTSPTPITWTTAPTCGVYKSTDTAFATRLTTAQAAGTYVTHCSGGVSANYSPSTYTNGSLAVTGTTASVVTAQTRTITYGTTLPAITYTASSTPATWTTVPTCRVYSSATSNTALTGTQNAGTYVTKCSGGAATGYTFTYTNGALTISKVAVTVTAQTRSITFGTAIPAITYTSNPTAATYTTAPTCRVYASAASTTALTGSAVARGTYVTKCSGAVSTNYTPTYVNGVFTIA